MDNHIHIEKPIAKWPTAIVYPFDVPAYSIEKNTMGSFRCTHRGALGKPEPTDLGRVDEYYLFYEHERKCLKIDTFDIVCHITANGLSGVVELHSRFDTWRYPQKRFASFVTEHEGRLVRFGMGCLDYSTTDGISVEKWLSKLRLPSKSELANAECEHWNVVVDNAYDSNGHAELTKTAANSNAIGDIKNLYCNLQGQYNTSANAKERAEITGLFKVTINGKTHDCCCITQTCTAGHIGIKEFYLDAMGKLVIERDFVNRPMPTNSETRSLNNEKLWHYLDVIPARIIEIAEDDPMHPSIRFKKPESRENVHH